MTDVVTRLMALVDEYVIQERDGTNGYEVRQTLEAELRVVLEQPVQEPAAFASPGQLAALSDPESTTDDAFGRYIPLRKTAAGNFVQPLYTTPQAQPVVESSSELKAKWLGVALFACIKASGIIREDINELTVAELLHFA